MLQTFRHLRRILLVVFLSDDFLDKVVPIVAIDSARLREDDTGQLVFVERPSAAGSCNRRS